MHTAIFGVEFTIDILQLLLNTNDNDCLSLAKRFIEIFNSEKSDNPDINTPVNRLCINIMKEIISGDFDITNDAQLSTIKLKINESKAVQKNPAISELLNSILYGKKLNHNKLSSLKRKITENIIWYNNLKHTQKMLSKSQSYLISNDIDKSVILKDMEKIANEYPKIYTSGSMSGHYIERINISDRNQIKKGLDVNRLRKKESLFKTGLQGLNRIMGDLGGWSIGDMIGIVAMSQHHKSGTLMNFMRWVCTLNKPLPNREGIPTCVYVSFEDDITSNIREWCRTLCYYNDYKDPDDLSDDELTDILHKEFNKNGFELVLLKASSSTCGERDWEAIIIDLFERGFDVQFTCIDYFNLMRLDDFGGGNPAQNMQKMMYALKDFGKRYGFSTVVGVKANEVAVREICGKAAYPVKRYTQGVIGDAKSIYNELDICIFQHLEENHNGERFLTMCVAKYRGFKPKFGYNKFVAYKFTPYGILDDFFGDDKSVTDIYLDSNYESQKVDTESLFT